MCTCKMFRCVREGYKLMPGLAITVFCGELSYYNALHNGCQPAHNLGSFIALTSFCTWKTALVTSSRNIPVPGRASHPQEYPHLTLHSFNSTNKSCNEKCRKLCVIVTSLSASCLVLKRDFLERQHFSL